MNQITDDRYKRLKQKALDEMSSDDEEESSKSN